MSTPIVVKQQDENFIERLARQVLWDPLEKGADEAAFRRPPDFSLLRPLTAEYYAQNVVFIFCGEGGSSELTTALAETVRKSSKAAGITRNVFEIDWELARGPEWRAGFDGQAVGRYYAKLLVESPWLDRPMGSVHAIGISIGAFAADAFIKGCAARLGDEAHLHLTLLDPCTSRGLWGFCYGDREFGLGADFSEQILNTDDPVPSSNEPLRHAFCIDVTESVERLTWQPPLLENPDLVGHAWPTEWYMRHFETQAKEGKLVPRSHADYPRGTLIYAP